MNSAGFFPWRQQLGLLIDQGNRQAMTMMSVRFLVLSLIGRCDSLRALSPLGIGLERYTAPPRTLQPRLAPLLPTHLCVSVSLCLCTSLS